MAYSTIDKSTAHFNNKIYTGNGSTNAITGVGFQPNWVWLKKRNGVDDHYLFDAIRGTTKYLISNQNASEGTNANTLSSFDSDGFTLGSDGGPNSNTNTYASWNWLAGGTAPSQTYTVKVVSDSGNKYRFDDYGSSTVTLDLQEGGTYTFDQSDSSNSGHPLRFYTASDKSGGEYTTGVTTNGTPGSSGAYTRITVAASAPTLYYQCSNHAGMGGQANTNSTFGSSNFSGSMQSTVSANTTAGFSIVKYSGNSSAKTIGHGLGVVPEMIIVKTYSSGYEWAVYHKKTGHGKNFYLDSSGGASSTTTFWNNTAPTSSVFNVGGQIIYTNYAGQNYIAYCFASKPGYSKIGSYTGNNNADGTFVYTGFKPAFVMIKHDGSSNWTINDTGRDPTNVNNLRLFPNQNVVESSGSDSMDMLSNGFKLRSTDGGNNGSGETYIYMAFGQTMVGSNNVPATAR